MKTILIIIFLLFNFLLINAQEWEKTYTNNSNISTWSAECYDKGFIISSYDNSGYYGSELIKTDVNGNIRWQKTINKSNVVCTKPTKDGGYIVAGAFFTTDSTGKSFVLKLNACGEQEWFTLFDSPEEFSFSTELYELPSEEIIVIATNYGRRVSIVFKLDKSGKKVWEYSNTTLIRNVITDDNNNIILTGFIYLPEPGEDLSLQLLRHSIFSLDTSGKLRWFHIFGMGQSLISHGGYSVMTKDSGILSTSKLFDNQSADYNLMLIKYNKAGKFQWHKVFEGNNVPSGIVGIASSNDGNYIIIEAIGRKNTGSDSTFRIIKISENGDILKTRYYVNKYKSTIHQLSKTSDNKFILSGYKYNYPSKSLVFVMKINENLETDTFYTKAKYSYDVQCSKPILNSIIKPDNPHIIWVDTTLVFDSTFLVASINHQNKVYNKIQSNYKIFPNPFSECLNLEILDELPNNEIFQLKVYNLLGELILFENKIIKNKDTKLYLPTSKPGIYFLTLEQNGNLILKRTIIKN